MTDYSQSGEQAAILAAFTKYEHGDFLDIGAWDPIHFSNTRALIELGWSGLIIEPSPGPLINLVRCCVKCGFTPRQAELYGARHQRECSECGGTRYGFEERLTIIQAAVGIERGLVKLYLSDDALSTSDEGSKAKWNEVGGFYGSILAPTLQIEDILNQFGSFDFINIDTEGTSVDLFIEFLKKDQRPRCFCVEVDGRTSELLTHATRAGYAATHVNDTNAVLVQR